MMVKVYYHDSLSRNFEVSRLLICFTSLHFHNCVIKNGFVG